MRFGSITRTLAFVIAVALLATLTHAQTSGKARVEGTWNVTISVPKADLEFRERLTFGRGRTASEGPLVSTNALDSFYCSAGQGLWVRVGAREFVTTHEMFCFSASSTPVGDPDGTATLRERFTIDASGETLTGTGTVEFYGPDGALLGGTDFTIRGTKVPPPPASREGERPAKMPARWLRGAW